MFNLANFPCCLHCKHFWADLEKSTFEQINHIDNLYDSPKIFFQDDQKAQNSKHTFLKDFYRKTPVINF